MRTSVLLGLAGAAAAFPSPHALRRDNITVPEIACNGAPALCDRQYSNITWLGTHNSAFTGTGPADNQHLTVQEQLDLGVRFLTVQSRNGEGAVKLCHSSCDILDAGLLKDYLSTIKDWLESKGRENEVLTLILTNGDGIDVAKYGDIFVEAGLDKMVYQPKEKPTLETWPTLRELLTAGTRLIVYMGQFGV